MPQDFKPGYKTTEFMLAAGTTLVMVNAPKLGLEIDQPTAASVTAIVASYIGARAFDKRTHTIRRHSNGKNKGKKKNREIE